MIDYEKKVPARKGIFAIGAVAAAALLAAGSMCYMSESGLGPASDSTEKALYAGTQETALTEAAAYTTETAPETETAAVTEAEMERETTSMEEAATHSGNASGAAYSKLSRDGAQLAELMMPAGSQTFTSKELILVNPWHLLPENYEADLEDVEYGHRMDACAAGHLRDMLADCRAAGYAPLVCSSFRERSKQESLFANDVRRFMYRGYTEEEAISETARNVAVPGSSEHEAGLAADIVYAGRQVLDESQELNETQQWLMEHCWEYGFILRYPRDKQEITGITYEPWHYRYVGREAAEEIMSRGICLEEYLGIIDVYEEQED